MIYQIAGLVIVTTCIICATWYIVTLRQTQARQSADAKKRREARNERIISNDAWTLYEEERQRRIEAETKCGIYQRQLKMAREQMAKCKIAEVK